MSISDDDLIELAQASYRRQAARDLQKRGVYWPIIPDRLWQYEEDEAGRESVVAYHGNETIWLRWTGHRFSSAHFISQ